MIFAAKSDVAFSSTLAQQRDVALLPELDADKPAVDREAIRQATVAPAVKTFDATFR